MEAKLSVAEVAHARPAKLGVLLINLGTPSAPTAGAVRRYLAQFLSDPRVVEIPKPIWWFILHGIILRVRPAKSAKKYASIWQAEGSPLLVHSTVQKQLLQGRVGERLKAEGLQANAIEIALAMRYGTPSIPTRLKALKDAGCDRILVLPLYPQYAASTTASASDAVFDALGKERWQPALRVVAPYYDDPAYIKALAKNVNLHWQREGRRAHLVMSFHGLPKRSLELGDPYFCHCHVTARLLAEALSLSPDAYSVAFQSRFGRAQWLQPYTQATVERLARSGTREIDVVCPGFVADCLETLEEIKGEVAEAFVHAGGQTLRYIPALNDSADWIAALEALVWTNLQGWLRPAASPDPQRAPRIAEAANALGVKP